MTVKKAKEYLEQIRILDVRIKIKTKELNELKNDMYDISAVNISEERVKSSIQNKGFDKVDSSIDLEREIKQQIDNLVHLRHKTIDEIQNLNNVNYIDVLYKRYVEGKTFDEIALDMGYSYGHITKMHGKALQAFCNIHLK